MGAMDYTLNTSVFRQLLQLVDSANLIITSLIIFTALYFDLDNIILLLYAPCYTGFSNSLLS